jgi:hypothetical protein
MPSGPSSARSGRNSMQGGRMHMSQEGKPPRKIISTSLSQEVKLRTVENAWKPGQKKSETAAEIDENRELLNRARGLLNKLTPDNYERILGQIKELELNTKDRLMKMMDLIFDKAIDEPAFCVQYANVCNAMTNATAPDEKGVMHMFGKLLLYKCQSMFEDNMYKGLDIESSEKEISECTEVDKKRHLIEVLDEKKRLARKKSLGNMKLIGELNRLNILQPRVMFLCTSHLLKSGHDESYECLCTLLRSIGHGLESQANAAQKAEFNSVFQQLLNITKQNKISSRIRFMILDLLELRNAKWVPRKGQEGGKPKTIKEIHNDVRKHEQAQAQISQRRSMNDRDRDRDYPNKVGSRDFVLSSMSSRKSQQRDVSSILKKMHSDNLASNEFSLGDHSKFSKFSSGARSQPSTAEPSAPKGNSGNNNSPANRYTGSSGSEDRWQRVGAGPSTSIEKSKTVVQDDDFKTFGSKTSHQRVSPPPVKRLDESVLQDKLKVFLKKPNVEAVATFREELKHMHPEDLKVLADLAIYQALEKVSNQPIIADVLTYLFIKPSTLGLPDLIEL